MTRKLVSLLAATAICSAAGPALAGSMVNGLSDHLSAAPEHYDGHCPGVITFLLTKWSGVPTVEGRMRRKRPDYEAYVQRTSGFIPMPPKKA